MTSFSIKPLLVIKVGTAAITTASGNLNIQILDEMVRQIVLLHKKYRIVLVSSGAVGCGKNFILNFLKTVAHKKAAAAVGNPLLMDYYRNAFQKIGKIPVAQALCEKQHFSHRTSFLQLWETFQVLWKSGIIPIVNENDVVADYEIRFSDNDELAVMIACGFLAQKLLFGSTTEGFLYKESVVRDIRTFTEPFLKKITKMVGDMGRGGIFSKLQCARKACATGVDVVIFDARKPGNILKAEKFQTGTHCHAVPRQLDARKKWMALGGKISGRVTIDDGAYRALQKRKSLLFVGVKKYEGNFVKGDLLEILLPHQKDIVGFGRVKIGALDLKRLLDTKGVEFIHADELVLIR